MRLGIAAAMASVAVGMASGMAGAQTGHAMCSPPTVENTHTYYLNTAQSSDGNEAQNAVRSLLPQDTTRVFYMPSQNALVVCAAPEQQALVEKVIHDLDRVRKSYRLTYTLTESDGGKRIGTQHFSLIVSVGGQRTVVKQGSKIPIATGSTGTGGTTQMQYQYLDIGMNFDATLAETATGLQLRTKVERSSLAGEPSGVGSQDPVVRQLSFEGTPTVVLGKPTILSSLDVPDSTRHVDVDVMVEEVK